MRVSYCEDYFVPLPEGHAFPMGKFPALHAILLQEGIIQASEVTAPLPASWDHLRLIHTEPYLDKLRNGGLDAREQRKMGLPWSHRLTWRSRLAVQGTINATRMALSDGIAANLAGGTHHAFPDHGEGFCVLNDVAIAIRLLLDEGLIRRALVIDLDVHQGNGTAAALANVPGAFTFSMHGERNYPWHKETSSYDVGLPDQQTDEDYLQTLDYHLPIVLDAAQPDIVLYLAGVDVLRGDRFGRLALSEKGLQARDRYVIESVHQKNIPLTLLMSGGYAKTPQRTAELHATAHREAHRLYAT